MVRETRHLWVGNLPDNIREERIKEYFKRYGRVQSVKLLPRVTKEETGEITMACTVAFMDIKSASKAHNAELKIDDRTLNTEYYEPDAIPSAASPQYTPSPYSTSPSTTRFPNGHGSSDEHGTFPERFYDRTTTRVSSDSEFIRRTGYHETGRGRNRDRGYRNGPYNALSMDRHRPINNSWSYDVSTTRYNSTSGSQTDTGYSTTPTETTERRNSDQSGGKKKTKSRSGSRSASPSGSTSSRSPSRSRSRSSSSSSSSSTSRATSSTSSPKSRRLTSSAVNSSSSSSGQHQPVVHSDDRRPLAICVKNLPLRSSDTSLKDGLFHEYKKHGKVTWVKVVGQSSDRYAIVCFKKPEDVEKALEVSYDKLFFGCKIEVAPYAGYDVEDNDLRPYEAEIDEYHPKATRTLFIGNLEKDVTASDLRKHFDQFGEIIEIDIKKQGVVSSYAFCQYSDIVSVVKAIRKMDGEHLGNNRIKLGFGKSMPTNCVWVDGVGENVTEKYLRIHFEPFGVISKLHVDRDKGQALIFYEQVVSAQSAVNKMRGFNLKSNKIQVDFASRECQEAFFEHLEKQGQLLERNTFEERRDSTSSRSFDSTTNRYSRYDTPTRPRTSSYSSRSSAATSQITSAIPSPGTPGSATPRGTGSTRTRTRDYYYEQGGEYIVGGTETTGARHFRNYDEYSQGSAASHEDGYEHEYPYTTHDSPNHLDPLENRSLQSVEATVPSFAPPDIRNLQKERVHLLEQLEECPSSGDELISPKKRLKLDLLEGGTATDVIIEANRDHRKVMEVRRMSDVALKHHSSRRPSIDSGKHASGRGEIVNHERGYLPHAVCKRRKTASSDGGTRIHHYDHSGSESVGGSRPGTPLCDERPDSFQPSEPRRIPRERDLPLTLPLPRFATQVMNRGSISIAGIKGQKDNVLSSPPAAVTSPRISNPRPPSPIHEPPPASPPPRPPSLSSNSSDSDVTPPSPSLEERIRSLDEKYEKWSGSRALSASGGDALAILDANLEKFRSRHKLLDLDLKEVQPSEIVKSVMAKRSVFDEDLKRLENVGEKYEPKEFTVFPRNVPVNTATIAAPPPVAVQPQITTTTSVPVTTMSTTVVVVPTQQIPSTLKLATVPQLPKTPPSSMLSPRSTGSLPAAKGLQYPFPSHPPTTTTVTAASGSSSSSTCVVVSTTILSTTSTTSTTAPTPSSLVTTTSSTTIRSNHGDSRLKSCQIASNVSDNRTSSKVNVNRTALVSSSLVSIKTSEKNNIPNASDNICSDKQIKTAIVTTTITPTTQQQVRDVKSISNISSLTTAVNNSEKIVSSSEKVLCRRDSTSSGSPRAPADVRTRRNSDNNPKRIEETEKFNCNLDPRTENEEQRKKERLEKVRLENERLEREKMEKERIERERIEKERQEKERLEKERLEKERLERESELEKQRLEKERLEKERIERERVEKERLEQQRREEVERREREEKERREREERERREKEEREKQEERERLEKEKQLERERKREDERRHKEDNHRHRENHSETKHNHIEKIYEKNSKDSIITKDDKERIKEESNKHESSKSSSKHHHSDRDSERRKDSIKENRDNNIHEKHKNFNDVKENKIESRHMSIDMDKSRSFENALLNKTPQDPNKRKERNNSLPANIGSKRRLSSHETNDNMDEIKRIKLNSDHKKLSERRDSKDSTRSDKSKSKNNSISSKSSHDEKRQKEKEREERHKNKQHKLDKQKAKSKSREKESRESPSTPKSPLTDKDFLGRLELRSNEDMDNKRKESKRDSERDERKMEERSKNKEKLEKSSSKQREESKSSSSDDRKAQQRKERIRKMTQNSSDNTDSDEPKKHSIFDIVDDEPAYISMYDKVKARSCKNMQKQEEEKRQEKIKAKFSQLKQSRAKREEKKRSTSWDEDSDSDRERLDKSEMKMKRVPKIIASSDDEEMERKIHKKKEIYTDSDSDRHRQIKRENLESSDDDRIRTKNQSYKSSKSRISSDSSDDEFKKIQTQIKSEIYSDNDQGFADSEEKPFKCKEDLDRLIKKERRMQKLQDAIAEQIFGDSNSPISDGKSDKQHNNRLSFADNSTDDEMVKKERSESRKKHKKKQKRQKHSLSSEESCKLEMVIDSIQNECLTEKSKHHDKKKQHSKKDRKRDKSKDERDKTKKSKKSKSDSKSDLMKRDGKMENIFGSLSEDSESGLKEQEETKPNSYKFNDEGVNSSLYNSESDREVEHKSYNKHEDKEQREKEDHKKRREKKRRDKERRLQEAAAAEINENSLDYADMGKQLEANIKDESTDLIEEISIKTEKESPTELTEEPFRFGHNDVGDYKKEKELKEKKKKRKKSKEEKQKHHHHHHHDKNKVKSPEIKKQPISEEIKTEIDEQKTQNQSLPNILDIPSPENNNKSSSTNLDYSISPIAHEPLISPIPKTPTTSKEKKREKVSQPFNADIDEKLHESAVKSISDFHSSKEEVKADETKTEKPATAATTPPTEEKPRVVISQEETEDAVAALLGESFGESQFEDCYNEEITTNTDPTTNLTEENNVQDDEEMRQAVQSLSSTDLDVKPDTPQSEHDLQIDTDTDEQDEISLRYDQPPKTPDMNDLLRPPKTPDLPSYMRNNDETNKTTSSVKPAATPTSPPSLMPIKATPPSPPPLVEVKKPVEAPESAKSLPLLPEARTVISQSWSIDKPNVENKTHNEPTSSASVPIRTYNAPPVVKVSESHTYPPLTFSKQQPTESVNKSPTMTVLQTFNKSPALHTLPARSPIQTASEPLKPAPINRLPITSITVSKPIQPTTVILPQSKTAHTLEPPKLVSTLDAKTQDRSRMIVQSPQYPNYSNQSRVMPSMMIPSKVPPTSNFTFPPVSSMPLLVNKETPIDTEKASTETNTTTTPSMPSIIVSATQMPVIQETPQKLVQFPATSRTKNVIQQTPPSNIVTDVQPCEVNEGLLKVENRTSTPSPVIVPTPKEQIAVPVLEKKEEPNSEESKLAIATVTEELNLSLKKDDEKEEPIKDVKSEDVKPETIKEEIKVECVEKPEPIIEPVSVIKETEKFDEEKADSESTVSDLSKERSSADILTKDDALDNKEDSDYWSAKEVNIDSVIKTLCSADELSDHSSEIGKDEWFDEQKPNEIKTDDKEPKEETETKQNEDMEQLDEGVDDEEKEPSQQRGGKRVSRGRGRKARGAVSDRGGIQTRRGGKLVKEPNGGGGVVVQKRGGGRGGGRGRSDRKSSKSESENSSTDVYEFRDDSDESHVNKERPRLILTIKPTVACTANTPPTACVKEVIKDGSKEMAKDVKDGGKETPATPSPPPQTMQPSPQQPSPPAPTKLPGDSKEEFVSPAVNTRKSKRLQERDCSRNTVDDTIEDVVRNTVQTRAAAAAASAANGPRRSGRQPVAKVQAQETPRKSPRGGRKKDRRASDTTDDSSEEKSKESEVKSVATTVVESPKEPVEMEKPKEVIEKKEVVVVPAPPKEKPHEGLKAAMLRRIKGEMNHEPTNLIDPVTGLLTPMRECEEGGYIPLPNEQRAINQKLAESNKPSVITQQSSVVQQQKPQSLKAHVLSSQAAKAVVQQHQQQQAAAAAAAAAAVHPKPPLPQTTITSKPITPISQHLSVNVAMGMQQSTTVAHLSPRTQPLTVDTKPIVKVKPQQSVPSAQIVVNQQQQQVMKPIKAHISSQMAQQQQQQQQPIVNTQMAHMKSAHQPVHKQQQQQQQVIINIGKSPHTNSTRIVIQQPSVVSKMKEPTSMVTKMKEPPSMVTKMKEPPKVDVSLPNMILNQRTTLSPQGPAARHVGQAGLPPYEASLGEAMTHFPPGSVPLRPPHNLPPPYMNVMPFHHANQFYYLPRSPIVQGALEKPGDGQEGEEAPVTSPPLELRRPGSVGLALTGRGGAAVPHSLTSPHDRATDSPQVGQVFNVHSSRMPQHYHPNRYTYEPTEPPPAHRPLTSHISLAPLTNDRPPDRPLGGHLQADRPLGPYPTLPSHVERSLSSHSMIGSGLGAAGNLMGAVARHVGADALASQRGIQAATPPHASQVPAQAESLFTLLKQYPCMWQGLLALKNDQAAVQMYFVSGNDQVARCSLPKNIDDSTPPLRIFQRMRLEPPQVEGVARKMQMKNEHCMLLALPCGLDHVDVLKQSRNLTHGFITYLQQKQAAGIVNVAAPGTTSPPAYVVHIFPSCEFVNTNLQRIAPSLLERVADIAHLLIVITTV